MIRDIDHLATHIAETLETKPTCRIFCDILQNCWGPSLERQRQEATDFAARHGWHVKIHEPAAYGIVADFSRNGRDGSEEAESL